MKITKISLYKCNIQYSFKYSTWETKLSQAMVIKIETDIGLIGWGEYTVNRWKTEKILVSSSRHLLNKNVEEIYNGLILKPILGFSKVDEFLIGFDRRRRLVREGFSIALYDLLGKYKKKPIYQLFNNVGKVRNVVDAMPVIHVHSKEDRLKILQKWEELGVNFFKIKITGDLIKDKDHLSYLLLNKRLSSKILIVDDDPDIIEILRYNLSLAGYKVKAASNGKEAIKKAKIFIPEIILLDVMMPEMDGIEACRLIREIPSLNNSRIIFLSARNEDYTQLSAFDAGADDYISKPVKPKILLKKISSIFKRIHKKENKIQLIDLGEIKIDRNKYLVFINKNEIQLPKKEFELFFLLASKPGNVFSRDEIMNKVWGSDVIVGDRTIDVHIRKLREKIGDLYFKTVKGIGYKFNQY